MSSQAIEQVTPGSKLADVQTIVHPTPGSKPAPDAQAIAHPRPGSKLASKVQLDVRPLPSAGEGGGGGEVRPHHRIVLLLGGLVLLLAAAGLAIGASGLRLDLIPALLSGDDVVFGLRAPRVLLAALTGAGLALAGVAMQAVLRNDLADPYILGVSGGASAGAVASLALWPWAPPGPAAAAGAAAATALVRALAGRAPDATRLVLTGVAVGSVLASATGLVLVLAPAERLLRSAWFWLFGGFGAPGLAGALLPGGALLMALLWMHARAERLDRLALGDDVATSLGVNVRGLRAAALALAVLLTASAVAVAGLIGFVGLIAPHAGRRLVGARHRPLIAVSALLGAALVMFADTVARTAFFPREVPVGLLTAGLGGPFFLHLLARRPSPWPA
jgi:iron complex transport system permease protein